MVFRIQAVMWFASVAARTAATATISSAISGRNTTVIQNDLSTRDGSPAILWEAEDADTGDAGTIYALIQAMTSPLPGSTVYHHTCFHGDNTNPCLKTAQKVW